MAAQVVDVPVQLFITPAVACHTGFNSTGTKGAADINIETGTQRDPTELANLSVAGFLAAHNQRIGAFVRVVDAASPVLL